jgi:hypothetical protein
VEIERERWLVRAELGGSHGEVAGLLEEDETARHLTAGGLDPGTTFDYARRSSLRSDRGKLILGTGTRSDLLDEIESKG